MTKGRIFFTSDPHYHHKKVIEYCNRPFETVEDMNITLMNFWNNTVSNNDTVFVLGDFSFAGTKKTAEVLRELKGRKILIMGNHDYQNRAERWAEIGFDEVYKNFTLEHNGFIFKMSHFPWKGANTDKRTYESQLERDDAKGVFLLHGHVHNVWKQQGNMINVGVDVWGYKPVLIDDIVKLAEAYTESQYPWTVEEKS